jgi:uncharacterized Zn-binding protein involved in type VI secretion
MRRAAVRHGDTTTTGGFVMAYSSTFHDDGKKIALSGDEATCGNCKGAFKIFGTGRGISEKGRDAVLDGDSVLCPCGKNKVIVGNNPGIFLTTGEGSAVARVAAGGFSATSPLASLARFVDDDDSERIHPGPVADAKAKPPDCSYLDGSKARIDAPADLYRHVNNVTVSPGKQTTFDFPGGAATHYEATVNGHPVSIYMPVQSPARGYGIPGEKEIVRALETVPPQQYKELEAVSLNASPNPRDALWQEEYGDSSFSSAATADIEQGVAFFPWKGWSNR